MKRRWFPFLMLGLFVCTISPFLHAQNMPRASMPFDMIIIGYDTDIGNSRSEKISILSMVDLNEGSSFGLINMINNSGVWESYNFDKPVVISLKIRSGFSLKKGTLLEIKNINGNVSVVSDAIDISHQFDIVEPKYTSDRILDPAGSFLTLFGGYFLTKPKEVLLGTEYDAISIGVSRQFLTTIDQSNSLDGKDIFLTDNQSYGTGNIDTTNCRLCDLLLIVLDPQNWEFTNGTPQDDIDLSDFNLEECAEIDCEEGDLVIKYANGSIDVTKSPCGREVMVYTWQQWIDGVFKTIVQGNGPIVPPLEIDPVSCENDLYRLIVNCENGCEYYEEISVECVPDCQMTFSVLADSCMLTATVENCTNPILEWWFVENDNSLTPKGNGSSIAIQEDGNYYIIVSGCEGCSPQVSPYYHMKGCQDCYCSQEGILDSCLISFQTFGCLDYFELWDYSENGWSNWSVIDFQGDVYQPTMDGYYRRTLINEKCESVDTIIPVDCTTTCAEFVAVSSINQSCQIEIDYSGCLEITDINISYALNTTENNCNSNQLFLPDGGIVIDNSNNGISGSVVIEPEFESACYFIALECSNGCDVELMVWNGQCCQGNLMIEEVDCVINTTGVPCQDTISYTWIIDGIAQQTLSDLDVPPLIPAANGIYQLEVVCSDGCIFPSNEIQVDCFDPPCESEVQIIPDECFLTASVSNCPDGVFQWQIDTGNGFQNIPGETNQTYMAISDDPIKIIVTNCTNCENDLLSFVYTPNGCSDMCDCATQVWVDANCVLQSSDTGCQDIWWVSWWKSDDGGITWYNFPESLGQNSFIPPSNGLYKKLIKFAPGSGCEDVEDEAFVDCLEECDDVVTLSLEITEDCNLKASWQGCYDFSENDIGWYFTNASVCPTDNSTILPTTLPSAGSTIEYESNPIDGSGYLLVDPDQGPGCYFFNFQCAGCVVQQSWIEWEECCDICIPEYTYNSQCKNTPATAEDKICDFDLISQGYVPHYYYASDQASYMEIDFDTFHTPTNPGWYKIILIHPDCEDVETMAVYIEEICPMIGNVFYDCFAGFNHNITGGVPPYSFSWGTDINYPSMSGATINIGDILPNNPAMPIKVTDANGSIKSFVINIDCYCTDYASEVDPKGAFKVVSWSIWQDGMESDFTGDWSDNSVCSSQNTSSDLESEILSFINSNCISVFSPVIQITISGTQVSINGAVDLYCGIESISLEVENCINGGTSYVTVGFNCFEPRPEKVLSSVENDVDQDTKYNIQPNPARNEFIVTTPSLTEEEVYFEIYDLEGQLVKTNRQRVTSKNKYVINSETLLSGLYLIRIRSSSNVLATRKLTIIQ